MARFRNCDGIGCNSRIAGQIDLRIALLVRVYPGDQLEIYKSGHNRVSRRRPAGVNLDMSDCEISPR